MSKLFELGTRHFDLAEIMLKEVKRGVNRVMQNTVNRALTVAKEEIYAGVVDEYAIRGSKPFKVSDIRRVTARPDNLNGFLHIKGRTLSINKFQFTPRKPAKRNPRSVKVSTEIHRGKIETWNHAFVAKLPTGKIDVLTRTGKFSHKRYWETKKPRKINVKGREYTASRHSTNLPAMAKYVLKHRPSIDQKVSQFFENELITQIDTQLEKAKK